MPSLALPPLRLLLALIAACVTRADPPPFYRSKDFDSGGLGIYPELKFQSTQLKAPQVNLEKWGDHCKSDEFFFICPRGLLVGPAGPTILNSDGHMIWHREDFGNAYDLKVQKYRGQDVLTFWSGDDTVIGHGSGFQYMASLPSAVESVSRLIGAKSLTRRIVNSTGSELLET